VTAMTPFLVRQLLASQASFPRNLRLLTVGGDQLASADVASLLTVYGRGELYLTYGLTEAGPRVSTLAAHNEPCHRFSSVGRPLRGVETWLEEYRDDGSGLLTVRTPTAALHRLGTTDTNNGTRLDDAAGLVYTGDVFRIDDDGYHYFLGRASDFIVHAGDKICLASIRRMAEEIMGVTRARTEVFRDQSSTQRYRLLLYTDGVNHNHAHRTDVSRFLMQLRPSERPAEIDWLSVEGSGSLK
jgi:long-chain acyl-CoA synthetase